MEEPLAWKGGHLQELCKRGSVSQCSDYRGVLLADHVAKRWHAYFRGALVPYIVAYSKETQTGGLPSRSADFASHIARLYLLRCRSLNRSAAILFLDVIGTSDSACRCWLASRV